MRALSSQFVLLDLQNSWHSATQFPISTLCYLQTSNFVSTLSSSFRRTRGVHKELLPPNTPPRWRFTGRRIGFSPGMGCCLIRASTSQTQAASELELFLELLPERMKSELYWHEEISRLIEVVMDLGRPSIARFPTGDWVISENPVSQADLQQRYHFLCEQWEFQDGEVGRKERLGMRGHSYCGVTLEFFRYCDVL